MIATSEVAISLTIDSTCHLEDIQKDLAKYGTIEVEESLSIICIVGVALTTIADSQLGLLPP